MKAPLILTIILLIGLFTISYAQIIQENLYSDMPIADTDNMLAPFVNPASLGYGNSYGIGWMQLSEEDKWKDHYWLFANLEGLSYVYEKSGHQNQHTLASGYEITGPYIVPNLYGGTSYTWLNDNFKKGGFNSGLLYRPWNFSSLAFTFNNPFEKAPSYKMGLGWRPFAHFNKINDYRLEFSVDMDYKKDEDRDYIFGKPVLGCHTEIIDGLKLGGSYNFNSEQMNFNVSICSSQLQTGSISHNTDDINYTLDYIFVPRTTFRTFLQPKNRDWYSAPFGREVVTHKTVKYEIGPFQVFDKNQTGVETILDNIKQAGADPSIKGIVFINRNFTASIALKQEIIKALESFKATGKKVVFYFDNMSNSDYFFAAAIADKIYLNPHGSVDLKGISINSPYLKDTLEKLGIEVINFRSHPTKTAFNIFSESGMTDEERAEYEKILDSYYSQICQMIQTGRGTKLSKPISEIIDDGPYYIADEALGKGLVDELLYETEFKEKLKRDYGKSGFKSSLPQYQEYAWSHPKSSKVAIIYAQGNIVMGKDKTGKSIAHETMSNLIRSIRKDKQYKGIIIRVDSGGGSAQASDIIFREIELARTENKKPVVISMTGVAGSGGYYIAANSNYIFAEPATLTGSIGVTGLAFSAENMFKKLYIKWDTVKKGKHSDIGNITRKWTDGEKAIMTRLIENSYTDFVSKVARSRNKSYAEIDSIAQGKIWTGEQALGIGLVDGLGGLDEAKDKICNLADIKGDIELVEVSGMDSGLSVSLGTTTLMDKFNINNSIPGLSEYIKIYETWSKYKNEKVLYLSPYDLEAMSNTD